MPNTFSQLSVKEWPQGLGQQTAIFKFTVDDFQRRGIKFVPCPAEPELQAALLKSSTGKVFALVHHQHQPVSGTNVWTSFDGDPATDLDELLSMLDLPVSSLSWRIMGEAAPA